jgi:hypothetical protein
MNLEDVVMMSDRILTRPILTRRFIRKRTSTRAVDLNQALYIQSHTPKLEPQLTATCAQHGILGEWLAADSPPKPWS